MSEPIAALIERSGPRAGRRHGVPLGSWTLGRTGSADLVLDHADVSRRHARLHVTVEGAEIEDLGSKNGTRIAGQAITRAQLEHGARFQFGDLIVELDHPGSRLDQLLTDHRELTLTRPRAPASERGPARRGPSIVAPLLVAGVFAILLIVLLVHG